MIFSIFKDDHKPMNQLNGQLKWTLNLMIKNQSKYGLGTQICKGKLTI